MDWTDSRSETWHVFTNGMENVEGGTSLTGIKTALTKFFQKKLKCEASPEILRKGDEEQEQREGRQSKTGPKARKEMLQQQLLEQRLKMETCPYLWGVCFSK